MKEIRILPITYAPYDLEWLYSLFCIDQREYRIVIDEENPQYILVFISHVIYFDFLYKQFQKFYSNDRIIIFLGDEAISPDMNLYDYAITYDDIFSMGDRICRRPTALQVRGMGLISIGNQIKTENAGEEFERRKFCNFIYSNSNANAYRDLLFYTLNRYQKVDSLGSHLHNCATEVTRENENWFKLSIGEKKDYRFSIAAENSFFSGYTSEKIISSFLAHTVPVYWGNPNIAREFNPKAFINCHDYESVDEVLEAVIKVNEDKDLWCAMVEQPWQTMEQIDMQNKQIAEYRKFVNNIFNQDIQDAKRVYQGTSVWGYIDFCMNRRKNI